MPSYEQLSDGKGEVILTANTDDFIIGDRVWVNGVKPGYIQYLGETRFSQGDWAGVVLDDHTGGKNDGSVAGVRYFQCEPKRGVFARLHKLTRYPLVTAAKTASSGSGGSPPSCVTPPNVQRCLTPTRTPSPGSLRLREGDRVTVSSNNGPYKSGVLRYLGHTDFASGEWAGVELDEPLGKNDGTVAGKRYFKCSRNYGLFAPLHKVTKTTGSLHRRHNSGSSSSRETVSEKDSASQQEILKRKDQETQRLKQYLESSEADRKKLVAELEKEKRKVEELEFRVDELSVGKDDLEMERDAERQRTKDLEKRLQVESRKENLYRREPAMSMLLGREGEELRKKEESLMQTQLSLDNKKREVQNLLARIAETEKELQENKTRQERQLHIIDELNIKLQKSESRCSQLAEEVHSAHEKFEETEKLVGSTNDRLAQLEEENRVLQEKSSKGLNEGSDPSGQADVNRRKSANSPSRQPLADRRRPQERKEASCQTRITSSEEEEVARRKSRHEAEEANRMREQLSRLQAEKDSLRGEKDELRRRLQASEEGRTRSEREAQTASDEVQALKAHVNRLKGDFSAHKEDLLKKLEQTRIDAEMVEDLRSQIESQRRLAEDVQRRLNRTEEQRNQLQYTVEANEEQQSQMEVAASSLRKEVEQLNKRMRELECERDERQGRIDDLIKQIDTRNHDDYVGNRRQRSKSPPLERVNSPLSKSIDKEERDLIEKEKEVLEQQVHFLNSVIVDMQHKNDDLKSRLDILETQVLFDGHLQIASTAPRRTTPRLYCDSCDLYDLHDSEDCPVRIPSYRLRRKLSYSSQESEF